jgi:arrestin-related trafficking adapter 4/5/7
VNTAPRTPGMVPTPRGAHHGSSGKAKPTLEILPDTRFIVFHGGEHEAQSVKLAGRIRFTAPEAMSILKPKVRLEGKRKISWWFMGGISAGEVVDKRVFWNQEQKLGIESTHKVKAGSIEWPFEFELDPSMPESVEGLRETYIVYHLYASVSRPGWNAKDVLAQEHIRIVRTLGQDSMEMTRSRVNADIWANKIAYSISIPTDAIVFGTSITADVELSPIKKGLRMGKIELRLMETVVKRIQASEVPDIRSDKTKTEETEVAKADMEFPEQSKIMYDNETVDNPVMADEMYKFKATLPLPKSLNVCRQDVDSHQINVTHRFKLMVNIHNPEGHVSQLVCRLPVKLFISPNLPVDERNEVCGSVSGVSDEQLNSTETTVVAPPQYGRHMLDQIYSDIDPSGYMSRAGSGSNTPAGFYAQSRRSSHENLASLNGLANGVASNGENGDPSTHHGSATPSILHSRLADLQERGQNFTATTSSVRFAAHSPSGGTSPAPGLVSESPEYSRSVATNSGAGSYFPSAGQSPNVSAPMSRRASDDDHTDEIHQNDYDLNTLSRVPSYGAALRTPGTVTPFTEGPPSYVEATSRPPSPGMLQRPTQAHFRPAGQNEQQSGTSTPDSSHTLTTPFSNMSMTEAQTQRPQRAHRESAAGEEEARVRMLRAMN